MTYKIVESIFQYFTKRVHKHLHSIRNFFYSSFLILFASVSWQTDWIVGCGECLQHWCRYISPCLFNTSPFAFWHRGFFTFIKSIWIFISKMKGERNWKRERESKSEAFYHHLHYGLCIWMFVCLRVCRRANFAVALTDCYFWYTLNTNRFIIVPFISLPPAPHPPRQSFLVSIAIVIVCRLFGTVERSENHRVINA